MVRLLDATREGEGVQIYIGADNPLFGVAGCSMIVAPYSNSREQVVGAIGVHRPDADQLCADHSAGRLHRQGDRPACSDEVMAGMNDEQNGASDPRRSGARSGGADGRGTARRGRSRARRDQGPAAARARRDRERAPPRRSASAPTRQRYGAANFAKDLLSVADNLRRALASVPEGEAQDERTRNLLAGVAATERELLAAFERHGHQAHRARGRRPLRPQPPSRRCSRSKTPAKRPAASSRCCSPAMSCTTACCARRWSASPKPPPAPASQPAPPSADRSPGGRPRREGGLRPSAAPAPGQFSKFALRNRPPPL